METIVEDLEELEAHLGRLLEDPTLPINEALTVVSSLSEEVPGGNDLFPASFPWPSLVGPNGVLPRLKPIAENGRKEFGKLLEYLLKFFIPTIEKHPDKFKDKHKELKGLSKTLYLKNLSSAASVEALKLLCVTLELSRDQDTEAEIYEIFKSLFAEFCKTSKLQPTVDSQLKQTLGKICFLYPGCFGELPLRLVAEFIFLLTAAISDDKRKLDMTILEGTVQGLDSLLFDCDLAAVERHYKRDNPPLEDLYVVVQKLCRFPSQEAEVTRRGLMRAGLLLFTNHSQLFSSLILGEASIWRRELEIWTASKNSDDTRAGRPAMTALFIAVSSGLEKEEKSDQIPATLTDFLKYFRNTLRNDYSSARQVSICIEGYGKLCRPLRRFLGEEEYENVCLDVLEHAQQIHTESSPQEQDRMKTEFPNHLEAVAKLVSQLKTPSSNLVYSLELLCSHLAKRFPALPLGFQSFAVRAFLSVFESLPAGDSLNNVVRQILLETCSHAVDPSQDNHLDPETVTYRTFIPLWNGLLRPNNNPTRAKVFQSYIDSFIEIVDKLNLDVYKDDEGEAEEKMEVDESPQISLTQAENGGNGHAHELRREMNATFGKRAKKVKDHTVLVNLVDITIQVLKICQGLSVGWLPELWRQLTAWSHEHNDTSAFYKLAGQLLEVSKCRQLVPGSPLMTVISEFLEDHLQKSNSFSQAELRMTSYGLVTKIPVVLANNLLRLLPMVYDQLFQLAAKVPELANAALTTINNYLDSFSQDSLEELLQAVIPNLRVYLSYQSRGTEDAEIKRSRGGPVNMKRRKKINVVARKFEEENCNLALDILMKLTEKNKELVLPSEKEVGESLTVWDTVQHLNLDVPLSDCVIPLYLDSFLPPVLDLVNDSGDRQQRTAAGELFHALLVLMIGRTSQQTEEMGAKSPMTPLFQRVLPTVLNLASDPDSVIQNLFGSLLTQMIHWFTKTGRASSPYTILLLDIILENICTNKEMSLKVDAGVHLAEFVSWAIRQSGTNTVNLVLQRLYNLWRHPDVDKRMGSSIAFNHIYRILREDKALMDKYILELLVSVFTALKISRSDPSYCETAALCVENLNHLRRIIFSPDTLASLVNPGPSSGRRTPALMTGNKLENVLEYLLELVVGPQAGAYQEAIKLFYDLAQKTATPARQIIQTKFQSLPAFLRRLEARLPKMEELEKNGQEARGSNKGGGAFYLDLRLAKEFQALYETCNWIFGDICNWRELANEPELRLKDLTNKIVKNICCGLNIGATNKAENSLSTLQQLQIEIENSKAILSLLLCLSTILKDNPLNTIISDEKSICYLLIGVVMEPADYGIRLKSEGQRADLQALYIRLLKALKANSPAFYRKLTIFFNQCYFENEDEERSPSCLLSKILIGQTNNMKHILDTYTVLAKHKVLIHEFNAVELLGTLMSKLPSEKTQLKNTTPDLKRSLESLICLIVSQISEALFNKIVMIVLSEDFKCQWFVEQFSQNCEDPLFLNLRTLVAKQLAGSTAERGAHGIIKVCVKVLLRDSEKRSARDTEQKAAQLLDCVMTEWASLRGRIESRTDVCRTVLLVKEIARVCNFKNDKCAPIVSWFCMVLKHPGVELKLKANCLKILGNVIEIPTNNEAIREALLAMSSSFPVVSSDLDENSLEGKLYISIFRQILRTLEATRSGIILHFIISIACREKRHICEESIQDCITRVIASCDQDSQVRMTNVPFEIFLNKERLYTHSVRLAAVTRFAVPALQSCSAFNVKNFFREHLKHLIVMLDMKETGSAEKISSSLTAKIGALDLFGVLYSKLDKADVHSPEGIIARLVPGIMRENNIVVDKAKPGSVLTGFLINSSLKRLTETATASDALKELYRQFHRSRLNCVIAVASSIAPSEKVFNIIVFQEKPDVGELIWQKIVDVDKRISLGLELTENFLTRKQIVTVPQTVSSEYTLVSHGTQTHYLSDSSLSQDISHYDFTASLSQAASSHADNQELVISEPNNYVEIEDDEIVNPCMAQLIAVAELMASKDFFKCPDNATKNFKPGMMESILKVLNNSKNHRNVKLFILKFIFSCQEIFEPFCRHFFEPILTCLADGTVSEDGDLNYLVHDLMIVMFAWTKKTGLIPPNEQTVSRVLTMIMKNAYHDRHTIFKTNIELVTNILQLWRERCVLQANFDVIEILMSSIEVKEKTVGLKLLAQFLAAKFFDLPTLMASSVSRNLTNSYKVNNKGVYQTAGIAMGLFLAVLPEDSDLISQFDAALKALSIGTTAEQKKKFIMVLHGVQKGYPSILIKYASCFKYSLKLMAAEELGLCFEMLETHADQLRSDPSSLPQELKLIGLAFYIQLRNPYIQAKALKVLLTCLDQLNDLKAMDYLNLVQPLSQCRFVELRWGSFEIFKAGYSKPQNEEIQRFCLKSLMLFLSDNVDSLRSSCTDFLNQNVLTATDSFLRMKEIFEVLYFEEHEDRLLHFLSVSILNLAKSLPIYNSKLFNEPLDHCNFIEYNVDTTWRMQHAASLLPMYADTLGSQSQFESQRTGMLKATLTTLAYSQTQAGQISGQVGFNSALSGRAGPKAGLRTKTAVQVGSLRAGSRFTMEQRTAVYQKAVFSKIAAREKIKQKQLEEDKIRAGRQNVTLKRTYRKGDLPDIQISLADLVQPILNLGHYSKAVAKILFSNVMRGLFENNELLDDDRSFKENNMFNKVFELTNRTTTNLITAILDLCTSLPPMESLNIKKITEISSSPGLEHAGILLLEKYLTSQKEKHMSNSRKRKLNDLNEQDVDLCINLVDLYRFAGEHENVKGLFIQNKEEMNIHGETAAALNLESNGNWEAAFKIYQSLCKDEQLIENHLPQEVDIWNKGYYESQMKMGKWELLSKEFPPETMKDLWKSKTRDVCIPALMTSSMHLAVEGSESQIYNFLNHSISDAKEMEFLKRNSGLELSTLFCIKTRFSEALKVCEREKELLRIETFGRHAITLNDKSSLLKMQAFQELERNIRSLKEGKSLDINKLWKENYPNSGTNLNSWDSILSIRRLYLNKASGERMDPDTPTAAEKLLGLAYTALGEASVLQKNLQYTRRCLQKLKPLGGNDSELSVKRKKIVSKVTVLNYIIRPDQADSPVDHFCKIFKSIQTGQEFDFVAHESLVDIVDQNPGLKPSILRRQMKAEKDIQRFEKYHHSLADNDSGYNLGKALLHEYVEQLSRLFEDNESAQDRSQLLLEGANFLHKLWHKSSEVELGQLCMKFQLRSMTLGSLASRELFPRLLNMILKSSETREHFSRFSDKVPAWMFVPWRDQLISCLHVDSLAKHVLPIVMRMVKEYPSAVMYSIKSSASDDTISEDTRHIFSKLACQIDFSTVHELILFNLSLLTPPHIALNSLYKAWESASKESDKMWKELVSPEIKQFEQMFLSADNPHVGSNIKTFAKNFGKRLQTCFKSFSLKDLKCIKDEAEKAWKKGTVKQLNGFSAYLANFLSSDFDVSWEIPGQYRGFGRPDPSRHVLISSIDPEIRIFTSKQMPIELRMIGSDGKRYRFIVKQGEDLRLDQRIENLFEIYNICLSHDARSAGKDMRMRTYSVIPLNKSLGLIEYVPDTTTLAAFMRGDSREDIELQSRKVYTSGINKLTGNKGFPEIGKLAAEDVIRNLKAASSVLEPVYLKNAVLRLSASSDAFYHLRKKFVTSYAVLSIMQWILGIGDRHSSNYLVCLKTGRVITIDFGYSFGIATSFLPVPELVQLRLTPQLLGLLEPLRTEGIFRETMVLALTCLRARSEILVSALESFVQEPTLDWTQTARTEAKLQRKTGDYDAVEFARQRMAIARSKLEGGNPSALCIEDLRLGKGEKRDYFKQLVNAISGSRLKRPGSKQAGRWEAESGLTASEQVDCLIHQSTDPNLLGRMWVGWSPYT